MSQVKTISFDLDETLMDNRKFDDVLWFEEVPRLYAKARRISIKDAKREVSKAYDAVGEKNPEWYRPSFWFGRLGIGTNWAGVADDLRHMLAVYPDVHGTLGALSKKYRLVVFTNTSRELVELKIRTENLSRYFAEIISCVDDFGLVKHDSGAFQKLLGWLKLDPSQLVHVGDRRDWDYGVPRGLGIRAVLVDRTGKSSGEDVIRSLDRLPSLLQ